MAKATSSAILALFLFGVLVSPNDAFLNRYIAHSFDANESLPLIHLTVNHEDGLVYISAVNRLYQLNKDLQDTSLITAITGPVKDSKDCLPYLSCGESVKDVALHNNYNKMLLMDAPRDRIIVCGSIYQGICEMRSLQDISLVVSDRNCEVGSCSYTFDQDDYVACNEKDCSTVGVIAEGPTVFNPVLYSAATLTKGNFRPDPPRTITTRSLQIDPEHENLLFKLAVSGTSKRMSTTPLNERKYLSKDFKYSFATDGEDGFVYFLFQKNTVTKNTSVIARICKEDVLYLSYMEMNLTCPDLADHSSRIKGAHYVKDVGEGEFPLGNTEQGVLFVIFSNGSDSSLCMFTIDYLNKAFDDTLTSCLRHLGCDLPAQTPETCNRVVDKIDTDSSKYLCDGQIWLGEDQTFDDLVVRAPKTAVLDYNTNYTIPKGTIHCGALYLPTQLKRIPAVVAQWSYYIPDSNFSAITVHLIPGGATVAFIGTTDGNIIELNINNKEVYNQLEVGQPVLADMVLDIDAGLSVPHLYVMTKSKVFHVRVSVCELHTTCSDCLQARDPYCGWCILKSRCMSNSSCSASSWLPPLSNQCIVASRPEPLERTLAGNIVTEVNLLPAPTRSDQYECVFDGTISAPASVEGTRVTCKAPPSSELPPNFEGEGREVLLVLESSKLQ